MGGVLHEDCYGIWRNVPGFSNDKIIVSSRGYTKLRCKAGMPFGPAVLNRQDTHGYRTISINGKHYRVCRLVLLAFSGRPPTPTHTADHIGKHNGDFMKERGDDRIENLRWADKRMQSCNRLKKRRRRDSVPVVATRKDGRGSPMRFDSYHEAADSLGVRVGNISNVVNGRVSATKGWKFSSVDTIDGEHGELVEEWKFVTSMCMVSSRGRLAQRRSMNVEWNAAFKPPQPEDRPYARVMIDGKEFLLHQLVWNTFGARPLAAGETIDHIDRDKTNNAVENLRPASGGDQSLNQSRRHKSLIRSSLKMAVEGKPPGGVWRRWESQRDAAIELNQQLEPGQKKFEQANISQSIRKGCKHGGWEWRVVVCD